MDNEIKDSNKIKNTLTITIVDENGSHQFVMAKIMQKILIYGGLTLIILIACGYFLMSSFITKLSETTLAKQEAYKNLQSIQEQNAFLQDDIQSKTEELQAMRDKVNDLENMINIASSNSEKNKIQDIDLQGLQTTQKATILQIIPNGSPITTFNLKQQAKKRSNDFYSLVTTGYNPTTKTNNIGYDYYTKESEPVYATADGIVESIRDGNQGYGYGNLIRLSHVLGFSTAYTNLKKISVKQGDFVSKGDIIGYTTPSLDKNKISLYYEVRFLSEGLDTLSFIDWNKQNFKSIFDAEKNANIDLKSLMWALNDIVKLNDMSTHFATNNADTTQQNTKYDNSHPKQNIIAHHKNLNITQQLSILDSKSDLQ